MPKMRSSLMKPEFVEERAREVPRRNDELVKRDGVERVMCIIDDSGSMNHTFGYTTRMEAVVEALWAIVDASARHLTELGLMPITESVRYVTSITNKFNAVRMAATRLEPRGGTYYAPALKLALTEKPNRVILLADGEASDRDASIRMAHTYAERGIKIDTVAVGDKGIELLQAISEITGGIYTFCDSVERLRETFLKLETRARLMLEDKR